MYVAGGNIPNAPKAGGQKGFEPFLYFFDAQGDSVHLKTLPDSVMNKKLEALAIDPSGRIIAGGSDSLIDSSSNIN